MLAGASVAVSTTVAALAVWWAASSTPKKPKGPKSRDSAEEHSKELPETELQPYVRRAGET